MLFEYILQWSDQRIDYSNISNTKYIGILVPWIHGFSWDISGSIVILVDSGIIASEFCVIFLIVFTLLVYKLLNLLLLTVLLKNNLVQMVIPLPPSETI